MPARAWHQSWVTTPLGDEQRADGGGARQKPGREGRARRSSATPDPGPGCSADYLQLDRCARLTRPTPG